MEQIIHSCFKIPHCVYSLSFSPFEQHKIALAAAQHFGIVGNGALCVLEQLPSGELIKQYLVLTNNGVFDLSWSEENQNQIMVGMADGTVRLYDLLYDSPAVVWKEHESEVYGI